MQNWELWELANEMGGCSPSGRKTLFQSQGNLPQNKDCNLRRLILDYQAAAEQIANDPNFDRQDFTVVLQPFFVRTFTPALLPDGTTDPAFWSFDCFHYANKGHAIIAKMLWNNMMEPVGSKTTTFDLSNPTWPLKCPDMSCPYIRTKQNSQGC